MDERHLCRVAFDLDREGIDRFYDCPYMVSISMSGALFSTYMNVNGKPFTPKQHASSHFLKIYGGKTDVPTHFHMDYYLNSEGFIDAVPDVEKVQCVPRTLWSLAHKV